MKNRESKARSAVFLSESGTYHADRCEPLSRAAARGEVKLEAFVRRGYPGRPLPPRLLPELSTIGFWDAPTNQGWGLDWHRNEGLEITYLSHGKLDFAVDGSEHHLECGDLTITRPWQEHRVGLPHVRASRLHWIILDLGVRRPNQDWQWPDWFIIAPEDLRRLTELLRHNEQAVWRASQSMAGCFDQLTSILLERSPALLQTRLQLRVNELFVTLLEALNTRQIPLDSKLSSTRRTVELFLMSLPEHLEHSWSLDEMAEQCGLGRTRFADYCQQVVNLSPVDYLNHCRVEAAKKMLLAQSEISLTEIALSCGFQSSQYFSTLFHLKTGMAPREFRALKKAARNSLPSEKPRSS